MFAQKQQLQKLDGQYDGLAACRRTQLAPKIIRQNADKRHFWSEIMGFSIEKAAKTFG
jgi:hypothetical protein